jgi:Fe-S oxidoreductase
MEKFAGIDRRRSLPPWRSDHFRRWFGRHRPEQTPDTLRGKVILLDDCFTTFYEPDISRAAVRLLERAGFEVELAGLTCCCRPMISKGYLRRARRLVRKQVADLARRLDSDTAILGIEPSCILTLADEWPELVPGADTARVAAAVDLADAWLGKQAGLGRIELPFRPMPGKYVLHGHCHQKALRGTDEVVSALQMIPGLDLSVPDTGCCGMAGSFGYEKEHYDLSVAIANLSVLPAIAAEPNATILAPGTSCRHQIKDLANRHAIHPLELLDASCTVSG